MSVKVSVYSGSGSVKEIQFEGTKWSELQTVLRNNAISYNEGSMKAVVGETENTLESNDAVVPTTDFTLFLLPQKVKSGSEDSYDESYDDDDEDEVAVATEAGIPNDPKAWSKQDAVNAINQIVSKSHEVQGLSAKLQAYVNNLAVSPLDDKAKELMTKLFK